MPSMQAVSGDTPAPASGNTPVYTSGNGDELQAEPTSLEVNTHPGEELQPITPHDSPTKTYLGVAAASASDLTSEPPPTSIRSEPNLAHPALGVPPPLPQPSSPVVPREMPPLSSSTSLDSPVPGVFSRRMVQKRLGKVVLGVTTVLGLSLLVFVWLWKPPPPIVGRINPNTHPPKLELQCDSCPDGSYVDLRGQRGEFEGQVAMVALVDAPKVGVNSFTLDLYRAGMGRDERVELSVDVAYRAVWDLSGLAAIPAHLAIAFEAAPGVLIRVNKSDVAMHGGKGKHWMAVSQSVVGGSHLVEWHEESVEITASSGQSSGPSSPFTIRLPIVPLTIDTPSVSFHTDADAVVISGRTAPGASVSAKDRHTQADQAGYFELLVGSHPGPNVIEVSSALADHVPRTASATFTHVGNLTKVALEYQTGAVRRFDQLEQGSNETNSPIRVALAGRVQEWKTTNNVTIALLAVSSGCPNRTCLVRVEHPAVITLSPNQAISVFGQVAADSGAPGALPTVQSHFILE